MLPLKRQDSSFRVYFKIVHNKMKNLVRKEHVFKDLGSQYTCYS